MLAATYILQSIVWTLQGQQPEGITATKTGNLIADEQQIMQKAHAQLDREAGGMKQLPSSQTAPVTPQAPGNQPVSINHSVPIKQPAPGEQQAPISPPTSMPHPTIYTQQAKSPQQMQTGMSPEDRQAPGGAAVTRQPEAHVPGRQPVTQPEAYVAGRQQVGQPEAYVPGRPQAMQPGAYVSGKQQALSVSRDDQSQEEDGLTPQDSTSSAYTSFVHPDRATSAELSAAEDPMPWNHYDNRSFRHDQASVLDSVAENGTLSKAAHLQQGHDASHFGADASQNEQMNNMALQGQNANARPSKKQRQNRFMQCISCGAAQSQ